MAQIAITALSLPYLSQTHWVSRAFFVVSLVSGLLSVYYSIFMQRTIGSLYLASDMRDWLRSSAVLPRPYALRKMLKNMEFGRKWLDRNLSTLEASPSPPPPEMTFDSIMQNLRTSFEGIDTPYGRASSVPDDTISLFSAQMLAIPSVSINISLTSFLIGLAVYLAFIWSRNLDTDAGLSYSRNVLIIFLVFVLA